MRSSAFIYYYIIVLFVYRFIVFTFYFLHLFLSRFQIRLIIENWNWCRLKMRNSTEFKGWNAEKYVLFLVCGLSGFESISLNSDNSQLINQNRTLLTMFMRLARCFTWHHYSPRHGKDTVAIMYIMRHSVYYAIHCLCTACVAVFQRSARESQHLLCCSRVQATELDLGCEYTSRQRRRWTTDSEIRQHLEVRAVCASTSTNLICLLRMATTTWFVSMIWSELSIDCGWVSIWIWICGWYLHSGRA